MINLLRVLCFFVATITIQAALSLVCVLAYDFSAALAWLELHELHSGRYRTLVGSAKITHNSRVYVLS